MKIIDIHTHILSNIDDGSQSLKESVQMIQSSVNQGCTDIFLTPHSEYILEKGIIYTKKQIIELKKEIIKYNIPINIFEGSEIYIEKKIINFIIEKIKNGDILTMNHTKFILIEFSPYLIDFEEILFCINFLLKNQWCPIIAHIERLNPLIRTKENIIKLKKMGCKIQVNYYTLVKENDLKMKYFARELIQNRIVDFLGSDSHGIYYRSPDIKSGIEYIQNYCDKNYADNIIWKNAQKYLL